MLSLGLADVLCQASALLVCLLACVCTAVDVSGVAKSATASTFVADVNVTLLVGGSVFGSVLTSAQGAWAFTGVPAMASLTVSYRRSGYAPLSLTGATGTANIAAPSPLDGVLSLSITPGSTQLRAVFTWNALPLDMDLFFVSSCGACRVAAEQGVGTSCQIDGLTVKLDQDVTTG